jgi:hypothetical protein
LSLDQLQSVDMPLYGSLTPFEREPGFHGIVVSFQSQSKVLEFSYALCFYLLKPDIQALSISLPQHTGKVGDQFVCRSDLLIRFTQLSQVVLLPVQALFLFKSDPMGEPLKPLVDAWEETGPGFEWQDPPL